MIKHKLLMTTIILLIVGASENNCMLRPASAARTAAILNSSRFGILIKQSPFATRASISKEPTKTALFTANKQPSFSIKHMASLKREKIELELKKSTILNQLIELEKKQIRLGELVSVLQQKEQSIEDLINKKSNATDTINPVKEKIEFSIKDVLAEEKNKRLKQEDLKSKLYWALIEEKSPKEISDIIAEGADPNGILSGEDTPLSEARNAETVLALIYAGAKPNAKVNENDWSALQTAAYRDLPDVVEVLLEHGADANVGTKGISRPSDLTKSAEVRRLLKSYEK